MDPGIGIGLIIAEITVSDIEVYKSNFPMPSCSLMKLFYWDDAFDIIILNNCVHENKVIPKKIRRSDDIADIDDIQGKVLVSE